ncbi:patatin-like phospholipase family protein [Candidatus Peregrinibacteria bacterium]|nr:patatin-like phospholipase family protein [Candidatus Peregrinibacteria bacterium]
MKKTPGDKKIKIGIALGSGGAKGLAHIGVLKVLEKYNIKPDMIAGASMGAVVGSSYALGMSVEEIEQKAYEFFSASSIFSFHNFHFFQESLIRIDDIQKSFYAFVGDKRFEDCKIKFITLGMDLESGQEVVLSRGRLLEAVEASSAIPGIFPPVFVEGHYMVDGGLLNPTPVNYLREADMDIVLGVHLSNVTTKQFISAMVWDKFYKKPKDIKTKHKMLEQAKLNITLMVQILMRTIEVAQKLNGKIVFLSAHPDIIVKPYTEDVGMLQFERIKETIKFGEEAMEKEMPKLLKLIQMKQNDKK